MTTYDDLEQMNDRFAAAFNRGDVPSPPARKVAVLTCMDARLHPETFLGLDVGDAHVIRNAGGRATDDAIRSIVISQRLLGTEEIIVIHHTDCGMEKFTNEALAEQIRRELGVDVGDHEFHPFPDLEQSVRDDVQTLRTSRLIPRDTPVTGAIYDVKTGRLRRIV